MTYDDCVFLNCPFDDDYQHLFRALVFAVHDCGFVARSALEVDDGSEVRIEKIRRIIAESKFGIHDISRTELDADTGLPRFNMPLELGIFLGAKYFGGPLHRRKACIVFDRERYRYQAFCSDVAGQDVRAHHGDERQAIRCVRDALRTWRPDRAFPGGAAMCERYSRFVSDLPGLAAKMHLRVDELGFRDFTALVTHWLRLYAPDAEAAG